jgi:hypothetical protein
VDDANGTALRHLLWCLAKAVKWVATGPGSTGLGLNDWMRA